MTDSKLLPSMPVMHAVLALRDRVIAAWAAAVRANLDKAGPLPTPILLNTLPAFYDSLVHLLSGPDGEVVVSAIAQEHGGERARLSGYDTTALIGEFQLFRRTLFAELHAAGIQLSYNQRTIIDSAIDGAIRESATAFALIQAALREQFIAAITHDIRTPLANSSMAAHLIAARCEDDSLKSLAQKILENNARIDNMTRDLLDCIVFNSGEHLPLNIQPFDMAEMVGELVRPGVALDAVPVAGYWCRESIKRAIENLLNNAIKYGAPGHVVQVRVEQANARVIISVHNDGTPIPPEELEAIFQIYHRAAGTKKQRDGWGVGLPYARRVAESHGGSIIVTSTVDTGTTFVIDVPVDARPFEGAPSAA